MAVGSSLTVVTALCHCARHSNTCLVLFQPRKVCPDITEKLLTGSKESNHLVSSFKVVSMSRLVPTGTK